MATNWRTGSGLQLVFPKSVVVASNEGKEGLELQTEYLAKRCQRLPGQGRRIYVSPTETVQLVFRESEYPGDAYQALGLARQHSTEDIAEPIEHCCAMRLKQLRSTLPDTADIVRIPS